MPRALSVAEKPSIAKTLARVLSGGASQFRRGFSQYNGCYDLECRFAVAGLFAEQVSGWAGAGRLVVQMGPNICNGEGGLERADDCDFRVGSSDAVRFWGSVPELA